MTSMFESFLDNIPLTILNISTSNGRRIDVSEYVFSDYYGTKDIGAKPLRYSVSALVHGIEHVKAVSNLNKSVATKQTHVFIHPYDGVIVVEIEDIKTSIDFQKIGLAEINLELIQKPKQQFAELTGGKHAIVANINTANEVLTSLVEGLSYTDTLGLLTSKLTTTVSKLTSFVNNPVLSLNSVISDLNSLLYDVLESIDTLVESPFNLLNSLFGITNLLSDNEQWCLLPTYNVPVNNPFLTTLSNDLDTLYNHAVLTYNAQSVTTLALNWDYDKLGSFIESFTNSINLLIQSNLASNVSYLDNILKLKNSTISYLRTLQATVPKYVYYTLPKDTNIFSLLMERYGNIEKLHTFEKLNKIAHLGFIPKDTLVIFDV